MTKKDFNIWAGLWSLFFMTALWLVCVMGTGVLFALMWKAFMVGWNFVYWLFS